MFANIVFRHMHINARFFRNVAYLLGFRRNARPVVFRTPPSAR